MSNNPNLVKLGEKRSLSQKLPQWLFPTKTSTNLSTISGDDDKPKGKKAKRMAKELLKRRAAGEVSAIQSPSLLLDSIESYLDQIGYSRTCKAFKAERESRAQTRGLAETPSLIVIFNDWQKFRASKTFQDQNYKMNIDKVEVTNYSKEKGNHIEDSKTKISHEQSSIKSLQVTNVNTIDACKDRDISASSSERTSSSLNSSDRDTDDDDEKEPVSHKSLDQPVSKTISKKRKAPMSVKSSSDSDSSSHKSARKAKKAKKSAKVSVNTKTKSPLSSSESSSSEDSSDASSSECSESSSESISKTKLSEASVRINKKSSKANSSYSDGCSKTSSNSNFEKIIEEVSGSDSASDSSESSGSSSTTDKKIVTQVISKKIPRAIKNKSTLITSTKSLTTKATQNQTGLTKATNFGSKITQIPINKSNEPFSRIPRNIKVDERLSSNAYVPYDYAQKAHEDLIVTKGRGFTKEKNKKKRGSYRGGHIDVEGKNGIKFED